METALVFGTNVFAKTDQIETALVFGTNVFAETDQVETALVFAQMYLPKLIRWKQLYVLATNGRLACL